jgi:cyanophycin synthetase
MAVDTALREAQPADLLLLFADAITRSWKQVIQFRPEAPTKLAERPRVSRPEPALAQAVSPLLEESRREFVRDTRGVWLAREEAD